MSLYDVIFARRSGGDPTAHIDASTNDAITYNNPGFRDRPKNGKNGKKLIELLFISNLILEQQRIHAYSLVFCGKVICCINFLKIS